MLISSFSQVVGIGATVDVTKNIRGKVKINSIIVNAGDKLGLVECFLMWNQKTNIIKALCESPPIFYSYYVVQPVGIELEDTDLTFRITNNDSSGLIVYITLFGDKLEA